MRILETLTRPSVILFSMISMIVIGASFAYFQKFVGGNLLDMSTNGPDALKRLSEMSDPQKQAHTWITAVPDSLYPIAYGSFFAGATLTLSGGSKIWTVVPAVLTMIADFCENLVQVLALNGQENLLLAKSIITPIKFTMFIVMGITLITFILIACIKYVKRRSNSSHE